MVVGFLAGVAVGGTAGYLIGKNSGGGGNTVNNIDQRSYDNRSYDQSQHYYGDMRSVQDVTNIIISKAIVDVGMSNQQSCIANSNASQFANINIQKCNVDGIITAIIKQKVAIDFQCIVRANQSVDQLTQFVNKVKEQLNQKIESDSSIGTAEMTATVQKSMKKIVNETVNKAFIQNVFEAILSVNPQQMINIDISDCVAKGIDLEIVMEANVRAIVSSKTEASFSSNTQTFNDLNSLFDQENKKMEKASSQSLIWGVVIAVIVIAAIFAVYKFYKKPSKKPGMMGEPGMMMAEPGMEGSMAPGQMGMGPMGSLMQTVNLSKVMPLRTKSFYKMFLNQ